MESIQIIHQDDHILIVNKPEGLLSIVDGYNPTLPHIKQLLEPELDLSGWYTVWIKKPVV